MFRHHHHFDGPCGGERPMKGGRGWPFGRGGSRPDEGRDISDRDIFNNGGEASMHDRHGGPRGFWERGFGREQGRHRGPGGRPGRPLEQGDLRWLVLDLIASQPRHGYEIIKAIEELFDGHYSPSPGVIYPTLTLLEETGLVSSTTQGAKKLYSLTDEGAAELERNGSALAAIKERLAHVRSRFGGAPAPELMRAMDNLRAAMQVRLSKGELSAEAVAAITSALDRAAGEIERS